VYSCNRGSALSSTRVGLQQILRNHRWIEKLLQTDEATRRQTPLGDASSQNAYCSCLMTCSLYSYIHTFAPQTNKPKQPYISAVFTPGTVTTVLHALLLLVLICDFSSRVYMIFCCLLSLWSSWINNKKIIPKLDKDRQGINNMCYYVTYVNYYYYY
jgi:hypothetical protein